ncbi:hypothetical protein W97_07849 [Coniosporium apollinis CBS 100218]|uniref:USP domain-containing protein n=1 Tax=Coniosporium apollinis (strain CBS 100218) TaxID=1168221 RepID=R7Z3X3_CONA1|nr:uncharacterized protein W97_07849 [Coniosporium apollinis CBS 100218]EON68591.1 hypothetical protein W97_07849 [Coniosporium apollinis CBS 100218]
MNGHGHGATDAGARPPRPPTDIRDLELQAQSRINPYATIGHLLAEAEHSCRQAEALLAFRKPQEAYVEYFVAYEIVVKVIARHKDLPLLKGDRGRLYQSYKLLTQNLYAQQERFEKVREIIVKESRREDAQRAVPYARDATQPRVSVPGARQADTVLGPSGAPYQENPRYSMPDPPNPSSYYDDSLLSPRRSIEVSAASGRSTPTNYSGSSVSRPPIHPKPQALHGRALGTNGASANGSQLSGDALSERFARLRANDHGAANFAGARPDSQGSQFSGSGGSVKMPSPADYNSASSFSSLRPTTTAPPSGRPMGPRDMSAEVGGPPHPPKVPLDNSFSTALPEAPTPAYNPARNMSTPSSINPPRSTARSIVGTGGRSNSMAAAGAMLQPPGANGDFDRYSQSAVTGRPGSSRRKSVHLPRESQITARKLYDYLTMYRVLLIDVRSREEFDNGHIFCNSILCVEPAALRSHMSAEELADALVLSPEEEQTFFDRRHDYDLVVYYDQDTPSIEFFDRYNRTDSELAMKFLYDALYEFNEEKPLQRPPILLKGGIEAWADLLGNSALKATDTAAIVSLQRAGRPGQPMTRGARAMSSSKFYLQRRRTREYNPLDAEEEQKWRERARTEQAALEQRPNAVEEDGDYDDGEQSPDYFRTTEDFLRRFPEAAAVEQQSMASLPPRAAPPPIPQYHAPTIPSMPSRPAPTAPRVSYSGVYDRAAGSYATSDRSSHLHHYVPPNEVFQTARLPRTGLINFGSTCYMNATIQCLSATLPLTAKFKNDSFRKDLQPDNWKGSKGILAEHYRILLDNLWKNDVQACRPTTFRSLCARLNREWGLDRQQDAKEFFDFLIDFVHEDLNSHWARPPMRALTEKEEAIREKMPKPYAALVEWGRYINRERSIITDCFAGQHASQLRCTTCRNTSTTYEAFYSISVEIPRSGTADIRDCLRSYCAEEMLSGDEVWRCPHCKKEREATKQITLTRAPKHLVVHFKRFSASHQEKARKVRTPIEFPLHGLDLSPYMLPPPTPEETAYIERGHGPESLQTNFRIDEAMKPPYLYNAYAVMRHLGTTMTSGHYIAMVKDPGRGCWREYNDERTRDFDPAALRGQDRLQNEQAYIVFYERQGLSQR